MRIFIAGAGMIGRTIANLLSDAGNQVSIADADPRSLALVARDGIAKVEADVRDPEALTASARGHDIVVSALPYFLNPPIAQVAHDIRAHYFDLTEDVATTEAVRRIASEAETAFIPQCGLAPGFIGIVTYGLARNFDTLHAVKMRVGALPLYPTNRLKYNLTWSTDGVINEYCNPCDALRDGKRVSLAPLEDVEHLIIDGVEYESFNTSGGLGTLCTTLEGKVGDLDYQTLRYPGHRDAMKFLLDDLRLRKRREILKDILESAIPVTTQDVVLIFVSATGLRDGKLIQESFVRKIHGGENKGNYSAIQITTASSLCAMIELLQQGKIPRRGFVRQEDAKLADFLATSYAREVYGAPAGG